MQIVTMAVAEKSIGRMVDRVRRHGEVFGIGGRRSVAALLVQFPAWYRSDVDDATNMNAMSRSFDFLGEEPDIYSVKDLKKRYA